MTYLLKGYQVKIYAISNFYLMLTLSLDYMQLLHTDFRKWILQFGYVTPSQIYHLRGSVQKLFVCNFLILTTRRQSGQKVRTTSTLITSYSRFTVEFISSLTLTVYQQAGFGPDCWGLISCDCLSRAYYTYAHWFSYICCSTPLFTLYFVCALSVRLYAYSFFVWCDSLISQTERLVNQLLFDTFKSILSPIFIYIF